MLLPALNGLAQESGIHFEHTLTFNQIQAKAKAEHKYVFVDCYASWCGPCKMMEREVYPQATVGDFVNKNFISIKLQMDSTGHDDANVKMHYADARYINAEYKIGAYPSFLFFDSNGQLVDRDLGYYGVNDFLKVASRALKADTNYAKELKAYQAGKRNYATMAQLAETATRMNGPETANQIAADYLHNYLDKADDPELLTKVNFDFISQFSSLLNREDRIVEMCLSHPNRVDSAANQKGYAKKMIDLLITNQLVIPALNAALQQGKVPDWEAMQTSISSQYNSVYAERNVLSGKVRWYQYKKDGLNYTHYLVLSTEKNGGDLNAAAWDIFQYDHDPADLEKALGWLTDLNPPAKELDTKAELLYKLGRKAEAVKLEKQAHGADLNNTDITASLKKMQLSQPTWPAQMP